MQEGVSWRKAGADGQRVVTYPRDWETFVDSQLGQLPHGIEVLLMLEVLLLAEAIAPLDDAVASPVVLKMLTLVIPMALVIQGRETALVQTLVLFIILTLHCWVCVSFLATNGDGVMISMVHSVSMLARRGVSKGKG